MPDENETAARIAYEVYLETVEQGNKLFRLQDVVERRVQFALPATWVERILSKTITDLQWYQEDLARKLAGSGLLQIEMRSEYGGRAKELFVKLTPLGRNLFDLARVQREMETGDIGGVRFADLVQLLSTQTGRNAIQGALDTTTRSINDKEHDLTNVEREEAMGLLQIMTLNLNLPTPDEKLLWRSLERISHVATVGGFLLALILAKVLR